MSGMTSPRTSRAAIRPLDAWYAVVLSLLITHEVEAAYWREWEMFQLPGGFRLFAALHLPLAAAFLAGFAEVVRDRPLGRPAAAILAVAGAATPVIHGAFLLLGRDQFRDAFSLLVLAALGAASVCLGMALRRAAPAGSR